MNNNLTEMIFILDRSGSMFTLQNETIGGYNGMIEKQKAEPGEAKVTTVLFDDQYEVIHDAVDIRNVELLTSRQYYARGNTALMDAIGKTVNSVGRRLANTPEDERPAHVVVVITTDGYENDSHEFTKDQIKQMIEHQTNVYSWKFMFLGAGIDAMEEAKSIGISANYTAAVSKSAIGTASAYACVDAAMTSVRSVGDVATTLSAMYDAAEAACAVDGIAGKVSN